MNSTRRCPSCSSFFPAHLPRCPECAPRGTRWGRWAAVVVVLALTIGVVFWRFEFRTDRVGAPEDSKTSPVGTIADPTLRPPARPGGGPPQAPETGVERPAAEESESGRPARARDLAAVELDVVDEAGIVIRSVLGVRVLEGEGLLVPSAALRGAMGLTLPGADPRKPLLRSLWASGMGWAILAVEDLFSGPSAVWIDPGELDEGTALEVLVLDGDRRRRLFAGTLEPREGDFRLAGGGSHPDRLVFLEGGDLVGLSVVAVDDGRNRLVTRRDVLDAWDGRRQIPIAEAMATERLDPGDLLELARTYARLEQWAAAVGTSLQALRIAPARRDDLEDLLVPCLRLLRHEARSPAELQDMSEAWEEALDLLRGNASVELGAALDRVERGELESALGLLEGVRTQELSTEERQEWDEGMRAAAVRWVQDARDRGIPATAVDRAQRGLSFLPDDVRLLQALGYALIEAGDAELALTPLMRVAALDAGRAQALDGILRRLQDASDPAHVAVIPFDMREGGIFTQATLNGGHRARVLVDTGATFTAISEALARALGIDAASSPRRARVETAAGTVFDRPVVTLDIVELSGAVQRSVDAVVMPLEGRGQPEALIGMNFLGAYEVGIDAGLGRMWLSPSR